MPQKPIMRNTLGKSERLKSRKLIEVLFRQGSAIKQYPIVLLYRIEEHEGEFPVQMTVSASKKNFAKATDRNRIKRMMREAYRLNKHELYDYLSSRNLKIVLIVMYGGKEILEYEHIYEKIKRSLERLTLEELPKFQTT